MSAPFQPMLAKPMAAALKKGVIKSWSDWAIEEKYDGHRLIIEVAKARHGIEVTAWTRPRGDDETMAVRALPDHIVAALEQLPEGVYDGELLVDLEDATGTDATRKDLEHRRYVMLFDVLSCKGRKMTLDPYEERHHFLEDMHELIFESDNSAVRVAPMVLVKHEDDVLRFVEKVWKRGGEGAILKRRSGVYSAGRRTFDFIKVKRVTHAVLTLIGFEKSRGTVRFPGHPFAVLKLRDADGNETTVKTKNDAMLKSLEDEWHRRFKGPFNTDIDSRKHPWVVAARRVMIEFPKRTRTGGYQGPVLFDRWAEEGE